MTDAQLDAHLDAVLKGAGSALRHYTMQKSRDDMRGALLNAVDAGIGEALDQLCEVRQDREMLAQALRGLLANPTNEAKQFARMALGD